MTIVYDVTNIKTGQVLAEVAYPSAPVRLPDGGLAVFGDTNKVLPEHDPTFRLVERSVPPALNDYKRALEAHVDAVAAERQYSGAVSIATYVSSTNEQWAAEAAAFIAWRDGIWVYAFTELAKVEGGARPVPTIEEFLAELPEISWPE